MVDTEVSSLGSTHKPDVEVRFLKEKYWYALLWFNFLNKKEFLKIKYKRNISKLG
jgi:hypothetical protein